MSDYLEAAYYLANDCSCSIQIETNLYHQKKWQRCMKGYCFIGSSQLIPSLWDRKGNPQAGPYEKD